MSVSSWHPTPPDPAGVSEWCPHPRRNGVSTLAIASSARERRERQGDDERGSVALRPGLSAAIRPL